MKKPEKHSPRQQKPRGIPARPGHLNTTSEQRVQPLVLKSRRVTKDFIEETLDWAGREVVIRIVGASR